MRSAGHGLNHMPPEIRREPLERFIQQTDDDRLRALAERALRGELQ